MPRSRRAFALGAQYVEIIHDTFISVWWPNVEPVGPGEFRDRGLVDSAVARPFQTACGQEVFPTLPEKAAALFHSLIANHPFDNGNKRTAVIALDLFLSANGFFLYLENDPMYELAKDTASYVPKGITHEQTVARIAEAVRNNSMPLEKMQENGLEKLLRSARRIRKAVRDHPFNASSNRRIRMS